MVAGISGTAINAEEAEEADGDHPHVMVAGDDVGLSLPAPTKSQ
jgi:hypothetical protein